VSEVKPGHGGLSLAIDYGPLLAFFVAFKTSGVFFGTGVFMAATAIAVIVSKWKLGRVSPMLWLSAILIGGFGALTLWFHDPKFIQVKPTIIYTGLGVLLLGGVAMGRPLLRYVLEAGFEGLSERGWMVISRNWGLFFLAMAGLNEVMVRTLSFDMWLTLKLWALVPLSVAFGLAHVPYMMKQGLGREAEVATPPAD
jgi:intracellular septation protein